MVRHDVLDLIPGDTAYGFDQLMTDLIRTQQLPLVRQFEGYWLDIGRPDDYAQAIDEFDRLKVNLFT